MYELKIEQNSQIIHVQTRPLIVLKRPRVQSAHPVKIGVQLWWKLQRKVVCEIIYYSIRHKSVNIFKICIAYCSQLKVEYGFWHLQSIMGSSKQNPFEL